MPTLTRLTALAVARAMLAGGPSAAGLAARMRACLDADAAWYMPLAQRCARLPGEHWRRLAPRTLASLIERDIGYQHAWSAQHKPRVRRYILREHAGMQPLPLGLDRCQLPYWPHTAALARWLGVSDAGMWRLTRACAWQRRTHLGDQHYRYTLLAKRSGGWRLLEVPHPYLMPLQRRLLDDLLDHIPPHEAACGYTRERSVVDHARAHAGQAVVLKFDLQDFFTSVRASRVHALFATLGYAQTVARELTALCTTATPEPVLRRMHEEGGLTWRQLQRLRDPHLPQGAPTSAALANLCAFRLDLRLDGLAHALGARYTRYADDIVLSGDRRLREVMTRIEAWVGRIALEEGFTLNHRKTRCLTEGRRQSVCSIVVNQHPNLPRPEFDRLKAILHQCVVQGPAAQNRDDKPHWREYLRGRVAWAAQLNPAKAQRLKRLFDQIDWSR
jgi:RNA-directed DNA polymerase